MSPPILDDLPPTLAGNEEAPRPFALLLNFLPIEEASLIDGKSTCEVWLYPGRPGKGPCEWGYCVANRVVRRQRSKIHASTADPLRLRKFRKAAIALRAFLMVAGIAAARLLSSPSALAIEPDRLSGRVIAKTT